MFLLFAALTACSSPVYPINDEGFMVLPDLVVADDWSGAGPECPWEAPEGDPVMEPVVWPAELQSLYDSAESCARRHENNVRYPEDVCSD